MGLFDMLQTPGARNALGLLAAAGPSPVPMSTGQRLLGFLQAADAERRAEEDRRQKQQMQALQADLLGAQISETKAQAGQREAAALRQRQADEQARADDAILRQQFAPQQGPTPDGSALMPNRLDPRFMLGRGASLPAVQSAMQLDAMLNPQAKPADFKVVGGSLVRIGGDGGVSEAYRAPDKPEQAPEQLRTLELIYGKGTPEYVRAAQALASKMTTHQPGTTVSVNTGQKGFDNTLKLRGDFRSEPIYKAHQEMQSAYSQVTQALSQKSPAGDLAGATKLMKLLDPGSVVRESELGMAMAASGLLDRVQNYATNIMSGTKLTPAQRADFQELAGKLFSESAAQYNAKREEYQGIAERNGLNTADVLGPASAFSRAPKPATSAASPDKKSQPPAMPTADAIEAELRRRLQGGG